MTCWPHRWRVLVLGLALGAAALLAGCAPSNGEKSGQDKPAAAATAVGKAQPAAGRGGPVAQGSGFDFYVLSLSWSPSYCEAEGADANRQQCGTARPYAFVVHGLWPQYERGYPQDCDTDQRNVPDRTLRGLSDIMPSTGLIRHEWKTHGSCSGLSQGDYFDVLRAAREKVVVPAQFRRLDSYRTLAPNEAEAAFLKDNPGLPADGIAVTCDRRLLREVRICMTRQLAFRSCPEIDRRDCKRWTVVMPPVRGG